jgi:nucleotide-binding universal stress UspA family protein
MYRHILVPVDGSKPAATALREALKLAREHGARISLIHVVEPIRHVVTEGAIDLTPTLRRAGERLLADAAQQAHKAGVKARTALVAAGSRRISAVIVAEAAAQGADLIAMGTHGRRGFERLILGSVAEGVARRATVPLLLLPAR